MLTRQLPFWCWDTSTRSRPGGLPIFANTWDLIFPVWSNTTTGSSFFGTACSIISTVNRRRCDAKSHYTGFCSIRGVDFRHPRQVCFPEPDSTIIPALPANDSAASPIGGDGAVTHSHRPQAASPPPAQCCRSRHCRHNAVSHGQRRVDELPSRFVAQPKNGLCRRG